MKNIIADLFLPSERNGGVPRGLSRFAFLAYLVIAVLIIVPAEYGHYLELATLARPATYDADDVLTLVNRARADAGAEPLTVSERLVSSAEAKLDDMLARQYFAHVSPEGKKPWAFFSEQNYRYRAAGENLAVNFISASDAHRALMQSETHRANIINGTYREAGIAVGQGEFRGRTTILIVQHFGSPAETKPARATGVAVTMRIEPPTAVAEAPVALLPTQSEPRAVLGADEALAPAPVDAVPAATPSPAMPSMDALARVTSLLLAALILLSLFGMGLRSGGVPLGLMAQAFVSLAIFGFVFFLGVPGVVAEHVTPEAAMELHSAV